VKINDMAVLLAVILFFTLGYLLTKADEKWPDK